MFRFRRDPVLKARRREEQERQDRLAKDLKKRKEADKRAEALFRDIYGDIELQRLKKRGYFELVGNSGTRYRFRPGREIQVMKEDGKTVDHQLCIHHHFGACPEVDTLITQALLVTTDEGEKELRRVANRHNRVA